MSNNVGVLVELQAISIGQYTAIIYLKAKLLVIFVIINNISN
jgi:hypothetical protein